MSFPCVRLEEVCDFLSGFAWSAGEFESEPTGLPIIRIQNVDAVRESDFVYWGGAYDERFVIRSGDILLTLSGSFRAEVWPGPDALLNQRIVKLTPKGAISPDWLLYVVRHKLAEIAGMGRHALVSNVALADLRALSVPLPPLPEQRRIAAILDKADALRTKRREALAQLDRLAQSIFVEMFGDPATNPKCWKEAPFDQFFADKTSSCEKLPSSDYQEAGVFPIVDQGQAAIAGYCDDESLLADVSLPVTVFGDHTRAVKHVNFPFVVGADGAKVLRAAEGINPRFASHLLATLPIPNLGYSRHMKEVKRLTFISPPREIQDSFENRLTAIDRVRERHQSAGRSSNLLFTAIQHRAFRGEL